MEVRALSVPGITGTDAHIGRIFGQYIWFIGHRVVYTPGRPVYFFKQLANPVSKKVDRFLEKHPEVTMAQLDHGFDVARKIDDIWVGDPWTFSHEFKNIVVENKEIVRIHSEKERSKRQTNYYLCMELADGAKERVLMGYHNLSEAIEMYRKYDHIRVEHNV